MPRAEKRLSTLKLMKLGPGLHHDGLNLYLQVTQRGNRSWIFRYYVDGKGRALGLGPLHTISLSDARAMAHEVRKQRLQGVDPIDMRRQAERERRLAEAKRFTFADAAEVYIANRQSSWKDGGKSAGQWRASLATHAYPVIGKLSVDQINVPLMMRVLKPIWSTRSETAHRVRQRVEAVLDAAIAEGFRAGPNPAAWRGNLQKLLPEKSAIRAVRHHAALPYVEVPAFMAQLGANEFISARALEFTILSAVRTNEAIKAEWSEFDWDGRLWTVPASRMKGKKAERRPPHRVPLSSAAMAVLARIPRIAGSRFVFPGGIDGNKPLSNAAMAEMLKHLRPGVTVHGMRSAFSDWTSEETDFAVHLREAALSHAVGSKVERSYRRGDLLAKRAELMEAWGNFCTGHIGN